MVSAAKRDERRHLASSARWWGETWGFELIDATAGVRAVVQLTLHPHRRTCWFWAAVRSVDRPYVLCRDLDLGPPADPLEIRGSALWSHLICETPLRHWTVAMEAYALELDPPEEAWGAERGERVGLAFDLEWESEDEPDLLAIDDTCTYEMACEVHGELQLGDDTFAIGGTGRRHHSWGVLDPAWFARRWPVGVEALMPCLIQSEGDATRLDVQQPWP